MIPEYHFDRLALGPIHLQVFGTLLVLGIITGHTLLVRRARADDLASPRVIEGFAITLGAGALIVGFLADHLIGLGLSSVAGAAGALAAGLVYALAFHLDLLRLADALASAFPAGWLVARLGCAAVHDHLSGPSTSMWAVRFATGPRLDLGLIEALLMPLLLLAALLARRTRRPGAVAAAVALGYPLLRFPLDFLREGDARPAGLTLAQWACLPLFALGLTLAFWAVQGQPVSDQQR
jgi:phosphatidylglycerol:prolipoprotein diacylglycerol transferase